MTSNFSSEFFAGNRARLRELAGDTVPIVIAANGLMQRGGDSNFPFAQDANFWYLTGIDEPDFVLVMHNDQEFLIAPQRTEVQDMFDGSMDWKLLEKRAGIETCLLQSEGWARLDSMIKKARQVATILAPPAYIEQIGMYTNPARYRLHGKLMTANAKLELVDLRPHLASLRIIKQAPELAAIEKAVDITCDAFLAVLSERYEYEYQLEAALIHKFRGAGAEGHAYNPIVAGGINACTLHYGRNDCRLNQGRLVLVDAGANYNHYAADITRTWPIGGLTNRQKAVLAAVNEAVEFGIEQLIPGQSFYDAEQAVRNFVGQKLVDLKLIKHATKAAISQYYPHSPHYLGLDVHDVGDYKAPLAAGMVLTLEPGIYIPEEFIGVRIEEDIVITNKGPRVLSARLPRLIQ